ncbi:agamous-like MADS-box protein AGL104 isoform X1 [Actinidia eriantha]|uniref:agamous-like MADS-box protein AGL104 isoform X1 n=1 Tax=Actinidia eriantha TaxID=165200 RepID=UPI002582A69F|nr:agamous-like MADS-box protein AGL104 isoform X1 [Actinidia eriantha]
MSMGRNKLLVKRIESPTTRQVIYSKRKDGIVKKANELSILCDTDVGLIMFSPTGRLTSFASNGRVEDIFLRFINRPDELKGGPISNEEALEDELHKVNRQLREKQEKMSYYNPNVEKIGSLFEAGVYQQFLENAIQHIGQSKAKLVGSRIVQQPNDDMEAAPFYVANDDSYRDESENPGIRRDPSSVEQYGEEICSMGPHLNLNFLKAQKNWNLSGGGQAPKLGIK